MRLVLSTVLAGLVLSGLSACGAAGPAASAPAEASAAAIPPDQRRSGYHFMSRATQALQDDDTQNPAFLWVRDGQARFAARCAGCHDGDAMRGVATRYPAFDTTSTRVLTLPGRIAACHERHRHEAAPAADSDEMLGLAAYVALASRGLPIEPPRDVRLQPLLQQGRALWQQRLGQLGLACADCHDARWGRRLAATTIPQAHATGYPIYRLEWQGMGSLQRRMRGCLVAVRAEPWLAAADEWVALELRLRERAAGMAIDAPAVRP